MKMNRMLAVAFGAALVITSSCMQEEVNTANDIAPEVLAAFDKAGFNTADIVNYRFTDGIAGDQQGYMVGGDIFIPSDEVNNLSASVNIPGAEQYRTSNLVNSPRTIAVCGYNANNANGLSSRARTALQWAVDNYNAVNIGLNYTLTFTSNYTAYDIVVYTATDIAVGGAAGFPSGGDPYMYARIGYNMDNYSTNVNEHVIGHEMGHCIGFRHTDYFDRSISCGSGGNEGSSGVGAIHIPGTGTTNQNSGFDYNSLMLACFSSSEDGEFSSQDRTALEYLY